jgi:hypothetical protein
VEYDDGGGEGLQRILCLLVQAGLAEPHFLQWLRAWAIALPHAWLPHHHHAAAAAGTGGVLLLLLGELPLHPPVACLLPCDPSEDNLSLELFEVTEKLLVNPFAVPLRVLLGGAAEGAVSLQLMDLA